MKAHSVLLALFLLIGYTINIVAQVDRNLRFTHLTNDNGLPTNTIYSLCQDFKGFIWIATANGLCKYDGRSISVYEVEPTKGERKKGGIIRHVFEDKRHRLWVITHKGVNLYNRNKDNFNFVSVDSLNNFSRVIYQDDKGKIYMGGSGAFIYNEQTSKFDPFYVNQDETITAFITAITSDQKGQMWFGRMYGGLICADVENGKLTRYKHNDHNINSLISNKVTSLFTDHHGRIWIGTEDKGICYFDSSTNKFIRIEGFPQICVRTFAEDAEGNIWIGSENGLYIYLSDENKFINYKQNYNDKYSLNDNAIYTIFKDKENNMLVGTYFGGLNIFLNSFLQFTYYDCGYSDKYLSGKAVRQIIGDKKGNLWIATEDGGLNYYNKKEKSFEYFKPQQTGNCLSYHNVHSLLLDQKDNLWIGTYLGGLNKYNLKTQKFSHYIHPEYPDLLSNNIFTLLQDKDEEIWIGTTNGLFIYNPGKDQFRQFEKNIVGPKSINNLLEDSDGDIWIATRTNGIFRYNKSMQSLQSYSYQQDRSGIPDNFINYIFEDSRKNIWIGTLEGGLCKFNKTNESFTTYTIEDGLPSNTIYAITESSSGNLWLSTNNGLSCLDINKLFFVNYSISEGLPNKQFNYNSVYRADDGLLYFGTINGMIAFYPENLQMHHNIAQVEFTDFKIYGKSVTPDTIGSPLNKNIEEADEIYLNSEQAKSFSFEFTVPTVSHPNSTFFAYKLDTDREWNYIGNQNQLTYANLSEGKYTLTVKAVFNNKWDNKEPTRSIKIIVAPPFWRSDLAYLTYLILTGVLGTGLYLFIKKRQYEKSLILSERMEKKKMEEVNTLKLNFFTNISHELRTPLSLILIPLQSFLEKNVFSPEIRPKMKLVINNAMRMNILLDELMLFSKVETRQEKIRVKKGNLLNFLRSICEGFQMLADEKGLEYILKIENSEEDVWFAPVKVEKIIYNLLSNAFKYTDKGEIIVRALYEHKKDYTYLNFIVSDTGVGIAPDQQDKIFENYYQINDFVKSKKAGFGIGLALTRQLVLLHKGEIKVESEINKGSNFIVKLNITARAFSTDEISDKDADASFIEEYRYLPVKYDNNAEKVETEKKLSRKEYKLLVVEDNSELLSTYAEMFSDMYTVITAQNGKEGYQIAKKELPDIIISDVMMPEMNGFELAHKLKSRIETCHIPLILLTAKTGEEAQLEGYESGADIYVEKPFHPVLIQRQISNLIATKENQKKLFAANKMEVYEMKADDKDKELIANIEKLIIANLDNNEFSLNYLLKEIGIGRTLLHMKLKNIVGLSATEFINNIRLKESLKILATGKNVSEAAYATGFTSPNYYSRYFKRVFGISPNEYIANLHPPKKNENNSLAESPTN